MDYVQAAQRELLKRKAQKELAKRRLLDFLIYDGKGLYQEAKHINLLTDKLEQFVKDVEDGKSPRLIICMPPRHSKSETTTKKLPAWVLGNHPDWEMIIASYSAELAEKFSRIARNTLKEHSTRGNNVFDVELADDSASVKEWGIKGHRGALASAGAGGAVTGKGAHIAIIDDPFKNREEANSKLQRDKIWDWYTSTMYTRLAPGGGIILVQTRWHDDDLAGRLIKEMEKGTGDIFDVINLPAIAEENDILGREIGEPLWPERYSLEMLEQIRKAIGEREFTSLYQQRPQLESGGIFRRQYFQYFEIIENRYIEFVDYSGEKEKKYRIDVLDTWCFQTIDPAMTVSRTADDTALGTFLVDKNFNIFLFDLYLDQIEVPEQWNLIMQYKNRYNPKFQGIENKASGIGLLQKAKADGVSTIKELKADTDKVTRAISISTMMENRKVFFYSGLPNLLKLEEQLLKFPNASHDDAVDIMSYAGILISELKINAIGRDYELEYISM